MKFNMNKWYTYIFVGKNRTFFGLENKNTHNTDFLSFVQTNAFKKKTHIRYDIYVIYMLDEWHLDLKHFDAAWVVVDKTTMQYIVHRFWHEGNHDCVDIKYGINSVVIATPLNTSVIIPDKNGKLSITFNPFDKKEKQEDFNKQVINLDYKEQVVELYDRDFIIFDILWDNQHYL